MSVSGLKGQLKWYMWRIIQRKLLSPRLVHQGPTTDHPERRQIVTKEVSRRARLSSASRFVENADSRLNQSLMNFMEMCIKFKKFNR